MAGFKSVVMKATIEAAKNEGAAHVVDVTAMEADDCELMNKFASVQVSS